MKKDTSEPPPSCLHGHNYWLQIPYGSTKRSNETVEFEGETYPLIRVEAHQTHTHSTPGRQKEFTQADGRVFNKTGLK